MTRMVSMAGVVLLLAAAAQAETVGKVGDRTITLDEVEKQVRAELIELDQQRFEILSTGLQEIVQQELFEREAKARGVSVGDLFAAEVRDKVPAPSDEDVKAMYDQYKDQIDGTLEEVQEQLREYLSAQRAAGAQQEFLASLREKYGVEITMQPPKIEVGTGDRPAKGPADAPVTIIAFSDYECPYCKRAEETVAQVLEAYPDKVRYVHRDFPLDFHANAHRAAQAARCAEDQGKFWELHAKLFTADDITDAGIKALAKGIVGDGDAFDACLDSGKYKDAVDADLAAGQAVGVSGTPAFFVNGRSLSGAQPFEEFKKIIDAELARAQ